MAGTYCTIAPGRVVDATIVVGVVLESARLRVESVESCIEM